MDLTALKAELDSGHPGTGAYNADATTAAGQLNAVNRTQIKSSMSGDAIFAATDTTEFGALTDHKQQIWLAFCGRETVDPAGASNVALVTWVFGAESDTLTALAAARTDNVSRATELELGAVKYSDIIQARTI